jgi:hypothetical protein
MTTFKPGDKVTVTGDDRVWTVQEVWTEQDDTDTRYWIKDATNLRLVVLDSMLTLEASTPLPPEPPIGSSVFVDGVLWLHTGYGEWTARDTASVSGWIYSPWAGIADRVTPVVPLADVLQALEQLEDSLIMKDNDGNLRRPTATEWIKQLFGGAS